MHQTAVRRRRAIIEHNAMQKGCYPEGAHVDEMKHATKTTRSTTTSQVHTAAATGANVFNVFIHSHLLHINPLSMVCSGDSKALLVLCRSAVVGHDACGAHWVYVADAVRWSGVKKRAWTLPYFGWPLLGVRYQCCYRIVYPDKYVYVKTTYHTSYKVYSLAFCLSA